MKNLFTLFLALVACAGTIYAESGTCGENLTWNLTDGVLTISGAGAMSDYTYNSTAPWYKKTSSIKTAIVNDGVTSIGAWAFKNCSQLISVTIPSSVTSIGDHVFYGCTSLTSIEIPNSVTNIGNYAFYECSNLISVAIPSSVTSIGEYAFSGCSSLPTENNLRYADTYLVEAVDKSLSSYTIKEGTRWVGEYAFSGCSSLASVTIPNSVTSIGVMAFARCISLTSVSIPNSVTSIKANAFYSCTGLTSVTIPNSVTSIGNAAFEYCSGLTFVEIPNSVMSIDSCAFYGCSSITSLTIPNSVTNIGQWAFYECSSLTSITCEAATPPTLKPYVFEGVNKSIPLYVPAESVDLYKASDQWKDFNVQSTECLIASGTCGAEGDNLTWELSCDSILTIRGTGAMNDYSGTSAPWYSYRSSIASAIVEDGVTRIGEWAFGGCTGLTSVTIGNSVTSIGSSAFSGCSGLTSIEIPNSVTSIGSSAFSGCSGLTSIEIPNSVTSIGSSAFSGCSGLKKLKLSANLDDKYIEHIGGYSAGPSSIYIQLEYVEAPAWFFDVNEHYLTYCPKELETIVINNGELNDNDLTVINRSYKTLSSVDLSAVSNTELADEALKNFYNLTELKLPSNIEYIGYMSVAECVKLQEIDIPASVKEIDDRAFENCRSLKSINFAENPQIQRIGNWAFYNCHTLQNLEIPAGFTEIGDGAFYGCTYLENLSLPASVQTIGDNTFSLCTKIKKMVVDAVTPPSIQAKTFFEVDRQTPVYVPDESVDAYKNDAYWKEFFIQGRSNLPTSIEDIHVNSDKPVKVLMDGQIYILRGEHVYDTEGKMVK